MVVLDTAAEEVCTLLPSTLFDWRRRRVTVVETTNASAHLRKRVDGKTPEKPSAGTLGF